MATVAANYYESAKHRYRLNENAISRFKYKADAKGLYSGSVEGIALQSTWQMFNGKEIKLEKWVRSVANPTGIIDYQKFMPTTGEVLEDPMKKTLIFRAKVKAQDLLFMTRKELTEICKQLQISVVNKKDEVLRRLILEKQNKAVESKEDTNQQ